jgi:hypothetical protein
MSKQNKASESNPPGPDDPDPAEKPPGDPPRD